MQGREVVVRGLTAAALVLATGSSVALATGPVRPLALTGTDGPYGPGLGPGVTFSNMVLIKTVHPEFGTNIPSAPTISGSGAVVFGGNLAGPGISTANGSGYWAARGGSALSVVARRGDQIPTMPPGYTYGELFTAPQICDVNTVTFQCMIDGFTPPVTMDEGTFTERSGWVTPLVLEGVTPMPDGSPTGVFGLNSGNPGGDPWGNNQWLLNRHGDTALRCFVNDLPQEFNNHAGIYTDFGGPLVLHSRGGQQWTDGMTTLTFMGQSNPRLNDSGAMITNRLSTGTALCSWSNRARDENGVGIPGTGPLHPLFLTGDPAPGVMNGQFYSNWSNQDIAINANGRILFSADLNGGGPGAAGGLWSDARFGVLQLVALSGAAAPGTAPGQVFNIYAQFVLGAALSDNNCVVLHAQMLQQSGVGGGNDTGLWTTRSASTGLPGNLRLLVREGSPVPPGSGPDFEGLNFGEITSFWINASGLVAFTTLHNDFTRALWIEQADGSLVPVVKEFTGFDVYGDGSEIRLISTLDVLSGFAGTGDGRRTPFNDHGDVTFRLVFAGGSEGIFTTAPAVTCDAPQVTVGPDSQSVDEGDAVVLTVEWSGTGPVRHQWRLDGQPIVGALGATYTISSMSEDDVGSYDCVLTNACGNFTSSAATVSIGTPCEADFNGNGVREVSDIFAFLAAWFAQDPTADLDGTPGIGVPDIFAFLSTWFAGCP
jgi:hypothetical protein